MTARDLPVPVMVPVPVPASSDSESAPTEARASAPISLAHSLAVGSRFGPVCHRRPPRLWATAATGSLAVDFRFELKWTLHSVLALSDRHRDWHRGDSE